jgi:hypothetical protein
LIPPLAVNVVHSPAHIVSLPLIVMSGKGSTVIIFCAVPWQPLASVAVTLYVVVLAGVTVIDDVVAPLLQMYVTPPVAVNITLPPVHTVDGPDMLMVGNGCTVTVFCAVPWQPLASVAVTLYVVVLPGLTVMDDVVAPLLQM